MLVGVSRRESFRVLRRLRSCSRLYSNENNMPSSDNTDADANSSQSVELRFAKLSENAVKPTRGSQLAAGLDLHRFNLVLLFVISAYKPS